MRKQLLFALVTACLVVVPLSAQTKSTSELRLEQFQQAHPDAKFHGKQYFDDEGFFEQDGTADMIYGTVLATGATPQESAWDFYRQIEGIYAEEIGELVPAVQAGGNVLQGVMWNKETKTHGFHTFRFNQMIGGIPVFRSGIGFLVRNEDQFPVVLASNNFKEMLDFDASVIEGASSKVTDAMLVNVEETFEIPNTRFDGEQMVSVLDRDRIALPIEVSDEQLVIWAGNTNVRLKEPELAVQFIAKRGSGKNFDTYRKYLIIAAVDDGEVLLAENQILSFDVNGTVSGNATEGDAAIQCETTAEFALPYAEVSISGGNTVFADVMGNFNIPSNSGGNVTVNSRLEGQYFDLFDDSAGGSTPVISINVADPGSVDFLHNPTSTEFATANVNNYLHANIVRDFVLSFEPTFPVIANQTGFNVNSNLNQSCNAFYDGSSINMFRSGGGCGNTAIPDVIYHEYGHHLVAVSNNSQGQFGEGSGDTIGVLIEDDPNLAPGFNFGDCINGIRNANNHFDYPCDGPIHTCGQLLSGCVWDTINEIKVVDPTNARDITAALFVGMLVVRGQTGGSSTIGPEITIIFLQLDDDDGSIGNGTPHYEQIADAFNAHNMMAPELELIDISFPNGLPEMVDPDGGTTFQVDVAPIGGTPAPGTGVLHVDSGSGFVQIPMSTIDSDSYSAVFPAATCGDEVSYFVTVDVQGGGTVSQPGDAPATSFSAVSASGLSLAFEDTFDSDMGWTVSGDADTGQWERGIPNNGDRGDPSFDAEETGAGFCLVTGNNNNGGNDDTDVDGGSTIVTSPVLDASATEDQVPFISYYRWYSNDFGNSPFNDTFVVEISNNGGSTWVNLETVGPGGPEVTGGWIHKQFRISDVLTPTNNMRIRFNASDLGDGSVVEAGVDAVQVQMVECGVDVLHGDVNLDGVVDLLDVGPFIDILTSGGFQAEADINKDGVVDLLDVGEFVDLLGG